MSWSSGELAASTCHGSLTLNGLPMNTLAWASLNNFVLWPSPARRGENLLIPGAPGRIAFPKRKDETTVTLECLVIGDCDQSGTPHADKSAGLATNWMTVYTALDSMLDSNVGASLTLPNAVTLTGTVQVIEITPSSTEMEGALNFTVDLILPDGELT